MHHKGFVHMVDRNSFHENFDRRDEIRLGSSQAFGFVFTVVFSVIALWPLIYGESIRVWSAVISGVLLLVAIFKPSLLQLLNQLWLRFGMLLHKIISPIVMGVLFFFTVTPIAVIFGLIGKDPLNRRFDNTLETYWVERDPEEFNSETMKNQF